MLQKNVAEDVTKATKVLNFSPMNTFYLKCHMITILQKSHMYSKYLYVSLFVIHFKADGRKVLELEKSKICMLSKNTVLYRHTIWKVR